MHSNTEFFKLVGNRDNRYVFLFKELVPYCLVLFHLLFSVVLVFYAAPNREMEKAHAGYPWLLLGDVDCI